MTKEKNTGMKKLVVYAPVLFLLLLLSSLSGGVFFDFAVSPMFFHGDISPAGEASPPMNRAGWGQISKLDSSLSLSSVSS